MLRRYEEALTDLDRALDIERDRSNILNDRGLLLSYLGRYAEAIQDYQEGLSQDPGSYVNLYNIAVATVRWKGLKCGEHAVSRATEALGNVGEESAGAMYYGLGGLAALSGDSACGTVVLLAASGFIGEFRNRVGTT